MVKITFGRLSCFNDVDGAAQEHGDFALMAGVTAGAARKDAA